MLKAIAATVIALTIGTAPAPRLYDLQLRVSRNGVTLTAPRGMVRGSEQARFATQDADGAGWTVAMTPTPGVEAGTASVAISIEVAGRRIDVAGHRDATESFSQRMTTTATMKDPGTGHFDVPAIGRAAGLQVDLTLVSKAA